MYIIRIKCNNGINEVGKCSYFLPTAFRLADHMPLRIIPITDRKIPFLLELHAESRPLPPSLFTEQKSPGWKSFVWSLLPLRLERLERGPISTPSGRSHTWWFTFLRLAFSGKLLL